MSRKPIGQTVNYSYVVNEDGQQELGFRYQDTNGINIDKHYTGTQEDKLVNQLWKDIREEKEKQVAALKEAEQAKKIEAEKKEQKVDYTTLLAAIRKENERITKENMALRQEIEALNRKLEEKPAPQENKINWEDWATDFLNALFS